MDEHEEKVALAAAMNNLMLQSIFVKAEHLRIYGEVLNDAITDEEGQALLDRTKDFAELGEGLVSDLLAELEDGPHDDLVRFLQDYIEQRESFEAKIEQGEEKIQERGDDSRMFY